MKSEASECVLCSEELKIHCAMLCTNVEWIVAGTAKNVGSIVDRISEEIEGYRLNMLYRCFD